MNKPSHILDWYSRQSQFYPYWFIFTSEKTCVESAPDIENYSAKTGLEELESALARLMPRQKYIIKIKPTFSDNQASHVRSTDYHAPDYTPIAPSVVQPQVAPISGISESEVEKRVNEKLDFKMKELDMFYQMKNMQAQIEELKKPKVEEKETTLEKHAPQILGILERGWFGDTQNTANIGAVTSNKTATATTHKGAEINEEQLRNMIITWQQNDPEFWKIIDKVKDLPKTSPLKYTMYKSQLLK